jgi:glycosyltransferase involved in cell wall biosynthesis
MTISVIMVAYNAEKYISDAIQSVLRQSYPDFELIIVDNGSTDNTRSLVRSFTDNRIVLIERDHHSNDAFNKGLQIVKRKYITWMYPNDLMHVDRLKIQVSILDDEPAISVCATQFFIFNETKKPFLAKIPTGVIEQPILDLLGNNLFPVITAMIRGDFMTVQTKNDTTYTTSAFGLMADIAMQGGVFYIDSQPLYYRRNTDQMPPVETDTAIKEDFELIKEALMNHLIHQTSMGQRHLKELKKQLEFLKNLDVIDFEVISTVFRLIYSKIKP